MHKTGFRLVDGDAAREIASATPRHWATCAVFVIVAQWLLQVLATPTTFAATLATQHLSEDIFTSNWTIALPALAWLTIPFAAVAWLTIYLSRRFDRRTAGALGLNWSAVPGALPWLIAGVFASFLPILRFFTLDPGWAEAALNASLWLIPPTLIQSGAEEVLFRGALLTMLVARYGAARGVLISAALFAMWHLYAGQEPVDAAVSAFTTFVFGVSSAILVLHQGHIGGAIALHFMWNLIIGVEAGLANWTGPQEGILGMFAGHGGGFWQSYAINAFRPWTLADLQDGQSVRSLLLPLFFETVFVFVACRLTFEKIFLTRMARSLGGDVAMDRSAVRE
jgi:membrane protease YdiL (CAAX protease family)